MPCRGLYLALTPDQEQRLLACLSDDEVIALVQEIEEEWDEEHLCQTDKAWDARLADHSYDEVIELIVAEPPAGFGINRKDNIMSVLQSTLLPDR